MSSGDCICVFILFLSVCLMVCLLIYRFICMSSFLPYCRRSYLFTFVLVYVQLRHVGILVVRLAEDWYTVCMSIVQR